MVAEGKGREILMRVGACSSLLAALALCSIT
jgi:hypothetical protein